MSLLSDAILAASPLFYLRCEEVSGTVLSDSSGNGNAGTLSGSYTLGAVGMSAQTGKGIDISNGIITIPHKAVFNAASDYAIEMVVRFTGTRFQHLFNKIDGDPPYNGPFIMTNYNSIANVEVPGAVSFRQSNTTADAVTVGGNSSLMLNDNAYRHFMFVRRALSLEIHVNGDLLGSAPLAVRKNVIAPSSVCIMNYSGAGGVSVVGAVDEAAYYDYAPSVADIKYRAALARDSMRVAGTAKLDNGQPASTVVARDWSTRSLLGQTVPSADGFFEIYVPAGKCDVTVFGPAGYQPITHGPIDAVAMV